MKTLTLAFILALLATGTAARASSHEHEHQHDTATQQAAATYAGIGVLKAVNAKDGKVQIAHEPIAELDWPSMTMWFMLQTPLPQNLKVGDKVRFEIVQKNGKQWVIVNIGRQ
jgi:Cu/Ag efflux protein CusF